MRASSSCQRPVCGGMKSCVPRGAVNFDMNTFFVAGIVALFALVPLPIVQTVLVTAASTLFESTPFILAGTLLAGAAPRQGARALALLGCGCGGAPPARSLPVAAAAAVAFGPAAAAARLVLAWCIPARDRRTRETHAPDYCAQLFAVAPAAALGAALATFSHTELARSCAPLLVGAGIALALIAPCGFGSLAAAAAVRTISPAAGLAALLAGSISRPPRWHGATSHDAFAYALAAGACALAAARHGAALVSPRFTAALWFSAFVLCWYAVRYRTCSAPLARVAPAAMLAAVLAAAPPPAYYATETTLQNAFAGERVVMEGALARSGAHASVVRYAVTCCRADAQPVSVELARVPPLAAGTWVRASGTLEVRAGSIVLGGAAIETRPPPHDPFMYR